MPLPVAFNGSSYTIPLPGDNYGWGQGLTSYLNALSVALAPNTGLFALTKELDFGPNWGVMSAYFKSRSVGTAQSGTIALANTDRIAFRNAANNADVYLGVNPSNQLTFNGTPLAYSGASVTSINISGANGIGVAGGPITSSGTIALSLGAITPTSVAATTTISAGGNISAANFTGSHSGTFNGDFNGTFTGTHSGTSSGTNTGNQTTTGTGNINVANGTTNPVISFTGVLPVANGGTGGMLPPAQGGTGGLLPVANGGTGQSSIATTLGSYFTTTTGGAAYYDLLAFNGTTGFRLLNPNTNNLTLVTDDTVVGGYRWTQPNLFRHQKIPFATSTAATVAPVDVVLVIPSAAGITGTMNAPATSLLIDGKVIRVANVATAFSMNVTWAANSGQSTVGSGGSLSPGQSMSWMWLAADSTWYRIS